MTKRRNPEHTTKRIARLAMGMGIIASVAANVISSDGTTLGRIVAAWPALCLLVGIHLFQHANRNRKVKAAITPIVLVAAWVSYWHMVEVVLRAGEGIVTAHVLPISIDGLMYLATVVLAAKPKIATRRPARSPQVKPTPVPAPTPTVKPARKPRAPRSKPAVKVAHAYRPVVPVKLVSVA